MPAADFFGDFERWYAPFWSKIDAALGLQTQQAAPAPGSSWNSSTPGGSRCSGRTICSAARSWRITSSCISRRLWRRSKRHLEIALPPGVRYRAGDYLSILPANPPENVGRALRRFGLAYDINVILHSTTGVQTFFPTGQPVLAGELLTSYVELGLPATKQQIEKLVISTTDAAEKKALHSLTTDAGPYTREILDRRRERARSAGTLQVVRPAVRGVLANAAAAQAAAVFDLVLAALERGALHHHRRRGQRAGARPARGPTGAWPPTTWPTPSPA